jgi:hypothetical protein
VIVTCQRVESIASTLIRPMNWAAVDHGHANGRNRRYFAVRGRSYEGRLSTLKLPIMILPTAARHNSLIAQDFFADTRGPVLDPGGMFRAKRRAFSSTCHA